MQILGCLIALLMINVLFYTFCCRQSDAVTESRNPLGNQRQYETITVMAGQHYLSDRASHNYTVVTTNSHRKQL